MSVRCGNCRNDHDTVADVKVCHNGGRVSNLERFAYANRDKRDYVPEPRREQRTAAPKDGFYTVDFGNGVHRTIRLRTQPEDSGFAPGEVVAAYLSGPMNESDYTGFAFVKPDGQFNTWKRFRANPGHSRIVEALQVVLKDPAAPAALYAQESGSCYRCNRTLTVPESIELGIGPTCREMWGVA